MCRLKRFAGKFGVITFGILLAIGILEIVGRVWHLVPVPVPASYQQVRERVGRFPEPYEFFWFNREDGQRIWVQFNYRSLRDIDHNYEFPDAGSRIMFIGDSFTAGWQVSLSDTYTGRLRQWLPVDYDFINAGFHGWGTDRQYLYYVADGYRYHSDVVVLQIFVGNDIIDNGIAVLQERTLDDGRRVVTYPLGPDHPYFTLNANGELIYAAPTTLPENRAEKIGGIRSFLRHYSFTYSLIERLLQSQENLATTETGIPETAPWQENVVPIDYYAFAPEAPTEPDWQAAWAITQALIRQLRAEVEGSGARLMVLLVDTRWQHDSEGLDRVRSDWGLPETWDAGQWTRTVRAFLDSESIPYLEPLSALKNFHEATGQAIIFAKDGHWTEQGQCVVAVELYNWFIEQGVLPATTAPLDDVSQCT